MFCSVCVCVLRFALSFDIFSLTGRFWCRPCIKTVRTVPQIVKIFIQIGLPQSISGGKKTTRAEFGESNKTIDSFFFRPWNVHKNWIHWPRRCPQIFYRDQIPKFTNVFREFHITEHRSDNSCQMHFAWDDLICSVYLENSLFLAAAFYHFAPRIESKFESENL